MSTAPASIVHNQVRVCPDPIFIIGAFRSGTSALARSLGEHSDLWYSSETNFLPGLFHDNASRLNEIYSQGAHWMREGGLTRKDFYHYVALGINALFTSRSGEKRWVEKTPRNSLIAGVLGDALPGAYFIHIVRDGRRVVHSMCHFLDAVSEETRAEWEAAASVPKWSQDFRAACQTWRDHVEAALDFSIHHPNRCLTVRYEELIADPEAGFRTIFQFVHVPHQRGPIDFFRSRRIQSSFPGTAIATPEDRPDPWQEWTLSQKRVFMEEAGQTMLEAGLVSEAELQRLEEDAERQPGSSGMGLLRYQRTQEHIQDIVGQLVPEGDSVLVVSRGDENLLQFEGRTGWHFPQDEDGVYAGYHPAHTEQAIGMLEDLRLKGAGYLLVPLSAFWWLDFYAGFRNTLETNYVQAWRDSYCVLYALHPHPGKPT
ncbi:MAG: sulfotransferase family protein [Chloroflexota bacterium]